MVEDVRGEVTLQVEGGRISSGGSVSGYVEIAVGSVRSGHRLEDLELKRRIGARKFPTARYELRELSGGPERFAVTGDLTWRGTTKPLTAEVSAGIEGDALEVEGTLEMDVRDFDMDPPKILGLQVHPGIEVVGRLHATEAR